jgi:hypothetical protein
MIKYSLHDKDNNKKYWFDDFDDLIDELCNIDNEEKIFTVIIKREIE